MDRDNVCFRKSYYHHAFDYLISSHASYRQNIEHHLVCFPENFLKFSGHLSLRTPLGGCLFMATHDYTQFLSKGYQ